MSRYHHFQNVDDPGKYRRKLSPDEARRVVRMKEQRGLTWSAIAAWFTRNGKPIDYKTARRAYQREQAA